MRTREGVLRDAKAGIVEERAIRRSRREFIQVSVAASGGLLLSWTVVAAKAGLKPLPSTVVDFHPNAYIRVDPDDTITIWSAQPDMGEGTKTSLPMLLVEETRRRLVARPHRERATRRPDVWRAGCGRERCDPLRLGSSPSIRGNGASAARARRRSAVGRARTRVRDRARRRAACGKPQAGPRTASSRRAAAALPVPAEPRH